MFQSPRVALQDLAECYPSEYFTHEETQVSVAAPGWSRHSLREAVLQYADNRGSEHSVGAFHLVGRLGAKIPPIRRRARYGLMDSLAFTGRVGDRCLEVGFGQARELRQLAYVGWDAFGIDVDPYSFSA